tara:strand:+ start:7501 stop:8175 length:675 start_codon:yes stop_codon:yes gene_type:complete
MTLEFNNTGTAIEALFAAGAVGFNFGQVIRYKSGILSPGAYLNNRVLQSHPESWEEILDLMNESIYAYKGDFNRVASVATGAIAHGVAIALFNGRPHVTVKKEEKTSHGLKGIIDGDISILPDSKVLLVEDMSSTFESALKAIRVLESHEATVVRTLAISSWNFPIFQKNTDGYNVTVLCDGMSLINAAYERGEIDEKYRDLLQLWVMNPEDESWITSEWSMPD